MPKIEIDENEYAELKRVYGVAELIGKHPEARTRLQEAVALAAPEQAGPEIRIRKEVDDKLSRIEKMFEDDRAERAKAREDAEAASAKSALERRWSASRAKARDAGYTEEGLTKLEDFMEKNGVADHELAIPAFERLNPPPEPIVSGGTRFNFFDLSDQNEEDKFSKQLLDSQGTDDLALRKLIDLGLKEARGR